MMTEILRTVFDLTPQEARVAALIGAGDNPAAIASAMDISIHTARTHVARIHAKTDTSDLLGLASRINALVPPVA